MTLSKRERIYAVITAVVVLAVLGYYLVTPYLDRRAELKADITVAEGKYYGEVRLLDAQPKVAAQWKALLGGNLKTDAASAVGKAQQVFYDAARSARFSLQSFKSERARPEGDFQRIRLQLACGGSTASLYLFLAALEKAEIPLRIEEVRINSKRPGADDLNVTITVETLLFAPGATATKPGAAVAPTGDI